MQDGRSKVLQRLRGTSTARGRARRASQTDKRVQKLARKLGNEEIAARIKKGEATREMMLAYIGGRLQTAREAQIREIAETHRTSHWADWREIADLHEVEYTKPDPTQWRAVAQAYGQALEAACRGDLSRAKQLIQRAQQVEQKVWENLTTLVDTRDLERGDAVDDSFLEGIEDAPRTGATPIPHELRDLIEQIELVSLTMPDPMNRRRRRDPWWTVDEEDEEEEGGDGAAG